MKKAYILVVDDERGIATILRDRLRSYGYEVECAFNGQTALDYVAERVPDCVLLDLEMPDINGFEVLKRLRKIHPTLPIVVVTASSSGPVAKKAIQAGANGYVLKPFDPKTLQEEVERALDSASHIPPEDF